MGFDTFIACSSEQRIIDLPRDGLAVLAGYWDPELGLFQNPTLLQWKFGRVSDLTPIPNESGIIESIYRWDSYILMPGWLDSHVHLALDSIDFGQCLKNWEQSSLIENNLQAFLRHYLELGVVAIRDGGDALGFSWVAKNRVIEGTWRGPQVLSVHEAVHRKGMYGRFLGRGFTSIEDWYNQETSFFDQGIDQLKVIVTGLIRFDQYGVIGPSQWSIEELKELVSVAHRRGIKVMAHASGEEGISLALEANVDSIEHGYYITSDQLKRISEKGIAWVPTVSPIGNILKYPTERYSPHEREILKRILNSQLEKIQSAYSLKVRLGIGTDAGAYRVPHADAFYDEMTWFMEAGIPRLEVYQLATQENARIFGYPEYGRIQIGSPINHLQLVQKTFPFE